MKKLCQQKAGPIRGQFGDKTGENMGEAVRNETEHVVLKFLP